MNTTSTKFFHGVPLSVLDLAPINEGEGPTQSFINSVELAQKVEALGYNRYWLAEHHNMPGIASSATSVIIGHIAGATKTIRVGAGGIMLPNHAPLVIAEQFGTLESIYPNRIDLGLGRAPGSDQATAYALRRTLHSSPEDFPQQLEELQSFFHPDPAARVHAYPGNGLDIPIWLLGSSDFSARLAAEKGLPFAFASHFSPDYTSLALKMYRDHFKPSKVLDEPYAMVGVNIIAAETDERAAWLATSMQQQFLRIVRGKPSKLHPPIDDVEKVWTPHELAASQERIHARSTMVGNPETVKQKLKHFIEETKANEVIVNSQIFHQADRLKSYEIVGDMMDEA